MSLSIGLGIQLGERSSEPAIPLDDSTLTLTELSDRRVYQRESTSGGADGKGQADVSASVTLSVPVTTLQYRVRRAGGGTAVDWTTIATDQSAGVVNVDCAVPATLGWVHLDFRADGEEPTLASNKIAVGRVIALVGQSLAVRMFVNVNSLAETITGIGGTINDNGSIFATYGSGPRSLVTPTWSLPADVGDYDAAGGAALLDAQIDDSGVNCALVGHAQGSTGIAEYITGGAEVAELASVMNAVEGFETAIFFIGHSDSLAGNSESYFTTRLSTLRTEMAGYNDALGSGFDVIMATIPNLNSASWGDADDVATIRNAGKSWIEDNGYGEYVQPSDIVLSDGVHQSMVGGVALARHFDRAMVASGGDVGPVISSATRADDDLTITLGVTLPTGATSLVETGDSEDRFTVYPRDAVTGALALDGTTPIVVGTNTITLKLASTHTGSLDIYYGRAPGSDTDNDGSADTIRSNDTADGYSVGRTLETTLEPMLAAALAVPAPDLTEVSTSYETSDTGWGQRLSSGYAYSASVSDNLPTGDVWTAEVRVNQSTSTGTSVMLGFNQKLWLATNAQGRLVIRFRNSADAYVYIGDSTTAVAGTNPVVDDGVSHDIAVVSDGSESRVYFDGTLVDTGPAGLDAPADDPMYVANLSPSALQFEYEGSVDQVALWDTVKYTADYTPETSPYVGNESGLVALYLLDGNADAE